MDLKKEIVAITSIFIVGVIVVSLTFTNNLLTLSMLIISTIIVLKIWHKKDDFYFFLAGSIMGSLGEIISIYFGAWGYTNPTFLEIPIWLPIAWGSTTLLIRRFSLVLIKIRNKE